MQVLENAVRMMKAPANEGARDRIEARDVPVGDFPDLDFSAPQDIDPPKTTPIAAPLMRRRSEPVFAEPEHSDAPKSAPLFAGARAGGSDDGDEEEKPQFGPILSWVGAAAAVALIAGISVWTYKLGQRDAMDVPIIAAIEGPARISPENPGGAQMAHQGLSVNGVLEGGGVADVASQVTVSAPEARISDDDAPQAALAVIAATRKPETRPVQDDALMNENLETVMLLQELAPQADPQATIDADLPVEPAVAEVVQPVEDTSAADAVAEAIALATPDVAQPAAAEVDEALAQTTQIDATTQQPVDEAPVQLAALGPTPPRGQGSAYAPASLSLPKARPADLGAEMSAVVDAAVAAVLSGADTPATQTPSPVATVETVVAAAKDDLSVIPLPTGTRLIQLGAFDSEAVARQQWQQISGRHGDLLGSKDYYVQKIDSSGRTFYRLRVAGYANKQETLAACAALTARGLPCMPTINR